MSLVTAPVHTVAIVVKVVVLEEICVRVLAVLHVRCLFCCARCVVDGYQIEVAGHIVRKRCEADVVRSLFQRSGVDNSCR